MTALAANRNTPKMDGFVLPETLELPVAAAVKCWPGAILVADSAGNVKPAVVGTGLTVVGCCEALADNSSGAAGDIKAKVRPGVFRFTNHGADPVAAADRFATCYLADDQTIRKTSNGGTCSAAGVVVDVDSSGVWVLMSPYFRGAEDSGLPTVQSGTATLVAGTLAITAARISATSRIFVTMKDPGAGAITGMAGLDVPVGSRVVGEPGAGGSFTVNAIDDAKATIATAVCTFDWLVIG